MKRLLRLYLIILSIQQSLVIALPFSQLWEPIKGAEFYEYEVAKSSQFKDNDLVRQGKTNKSEVNGDLNPGIYFLRVRAISANGPGAWTSSKQFILSSNTPELKWPLDNEQVFVSKNTTVVSFEWSIVEGADDYLVEIRNLRNSKQKLTFISTDHSVNTKELGPGKWSARVVSRLNKKLFTSGKPVSFEIEERELPEPFIVEPYNDLSLPSGETWRFRWRRNVSGKKSEIILTRLGPERHVVAQFWTEEANEVILPRLVSGRYQVVVRDYLDDSQKFSEGIVHVSMKDSNFSSYSPKTGSSLRLMGAIRGLWNAQRNFSTGENTWLIANPIENEVGVRLAGKVWRKWGYESKFGYQFPIVKTEEKEYSDKNIFFSAGPSWTQSFLGPQNYLRYKVLTSYRQLPQIILSDSQTPLILWGLKPALEFQWSSWRSYWDFWSEISLDFPVWTSGNSVGTGSPRYFLPALELSFFLRRELSTNWKLVFGPSFYLESLSVSEKDRKVKTQIQKTQANFNFGLEWDL
ncbi:hypothetical protein GW915_01295 [bacterium]|nr:hypothetical protein [bacterium]